MLSFTRTGRSALRGAARLLLWLLLPPLAWAQTQPEAPSGYAPRPAFAANHFIAVTANPYATDTAVAVLRAGGSAVDAAVAAALVLNVVEPQSSGIGGGGFMLHWDRHAHRLVAYDGRETAPERATADRFAGLEFREAVASGRSIGAPGLVAMLATAHRRHGRIAWRSLFQPAIELAENGFAVSPRLAKLLRDDPLLRNDPDARRLYYREDGSAVEAGSILRSPALAQTLRIVAESGPAGFYDGPVAAAMVGAVQAAGGDLDLVDLAEYRAKIRTPICGRYRAWRVCGMPPPSSGGIATLELLGLLERTPFAEAPPLSAQAIHWFAEAGRLAFADRNRYLGDADFIDVPQAALLAPAYLDARAMRMSAGHSMGKAEPGIVSSLTLPGDGVAPELPATTHVSIVDAHGNAVAMTNSVEDAFGSRHMAAGFLLNNQLTDFAFRPAADGRPAANRVEPRKRPLSSMSPTMVFDQHGRLVAVLGSAGGSRIINYVAQALVALLDWRMPPDAALALPHFGSRNGPTELENGAFADAVKPQLRSLGHDVTNVDMTSGTQIILRVGWQWLGAADPRREGVAAGE